MACNAYMYISVEAMVDMFDSLFAQFGKGLHNTYM